MAYSDSRKYKGKSYFDIWMPLLPRTGYMYLTSKDRYNSMKLLSFLLAYSCILKVIILHEGVSLLLLSKLLSLDKK